MRSTLLGKVADPDPRELGTHLTGEMGEFEEKKSTKFIYQENRIGYFLPLDPNIWIRIFCLPLVLGSGS